MAGPVPGVACSQQATYTWLAAHGRAGQGSRFLCYHRREGPYLGWLGAEAQVRQVVKGLFIFSGIPVITHQHDVALHPDFTIVPTKRNAPAPLDGATTPQLPDMFASWGSGLTPRTA
jgi:hypothetical protein